jgi:hypothetical protein
MNASLVVLLSVGLLAIVPLLCFVGCGLTLTPLSFFQYQGSITDILSNVAL